MNDIRLAANVIEKDCKKDIFRITAVRFEHHRFLMKCFSYEKHEIILTDYEISRLARYEIKFVS